ncbi:universal stress protein [Lysobacter koreensis]|uniref:Universal stress protein n=1 Tax=Lysobacter koreensis TaxID=266122 RepID=A0ABW2YI63_9GAMM
MFKDILVPLLAGEVHEAALATACALAAHDGSHLVALVGVSVVTPSASAWAYYPAGVYETLNEAAQATAAALAQAVEERLAREAVAREIRRSDSFWLTSAELAAMHARYSDLVVLGLARPPQDADRRVFAGVLSGGGRAVLAVPAAAPAVASYGHAVVAWKPSREAARAVHDALPLLQRARSVDVVMIGPGTDHGARDELPGGDIATHLARHGLVVNLVQRPRAAQATGESILAHAQESRADLIVAGGYSRARALEQVFGGVTRHLLEHSSIPVLFSH